MGSLGKCSFCCCIIYLPVQIIRIAFSVLTLLVGQQEEHPVCKKTWVVGYWHGYLSGARCILAYNPADATATDCLLLQWNPDWFYLSGTGLPGPDKGPLNGCVCVQIIRSCDNLVTAMFCCSCFWVDSSIYEFCLDIIAAFWHGML